jgi:hypothetical protein
MAYRKFVPEIWSEQYNRELEKALVFAEDCNRQYEGEVKQAGDTVRILGVGKPTITTTTTATDITLANAENVTDTSISMKIDQVAYYNFKVGDIDKAQAVANGPMDALMSESAYGVADEMDKYIAKLASDTRADKLDTASTQVTKANILGYVDRGLKKLYEQNVSNNSKITLTVPPWFYMLMKQAYVDLDQNNSTMIENGKVGRYGNVIVKMSNNVYKTGTDSLIMLRTDKAIAFANPLTHVEPYRPDNSFSDAVKGFVLYGGTIARPKEMVVLNCKE